MDWRITGLAVTALLGPFLTKAGETVAKTVGADLYSWLKRRFENDKDHDAQAALTRLEQEPGSKPRREALIETLAQRAANDPDGFGEELRNRVDQAVATDRSLGTLVGQIVGGNVAVINTMYGDIHM